MGEQGRWLEQMPQLSLLGVGALMKMTLRNIGIERPIWVEEWSPVELCKWERTYNIWNIGMAEAESWEGEESGRVVKGDCSSHKF